MVEGVSVKDRAMSDIVSPLLLSLALISSRRLSTAECPNDLFGSAVNALAPS